MAGSPTPAGHTDILISYVYNLAFSGSRGVNYGFAAAITIIIFFIVGTITLFQFRLPAVEEVSEMSSISSIQQWRTSARAQQTFALPCAW
jgi:maltose/maltodextrin transport system permease protein